MEELATPTPRHPAKFSKPIIDRISRILTEQSPNRPLRIIDPFAGPGGVHVLHEQGGHDTVGIEIQPEWARQHPRNTVGDSTDLSWIPSKSFDAMVTSPCYGNRMADSHVAKDPCKTCRGLGLVDVLDRVPCRKCNGSGLSRRNTYTHALREVGVEPVDSPTNAAKMQWGPAYRRLHEQVWSEMVRIVDGLLICNVSNHMRLDEEQNVVEWHAYQFIARRCTLVEARRVSTQRLGFGQNHDARVDGEVVLVFRTPNAPTWA